MMGHDARALMAELGMTTADLILPPRPKLEDDHGHTRVRWAPDKKEAFDAVGFAALALVATDGPVSVTLWGRTGEVKRLGHNRGIWPAKIAKTASWKDTVTATHDKDPFFFLGTQFRLWCLTDVDRDRLAASVVDMIAVRSEEFGGLDELRHGFQDLGPDLDLNMFEFEIAGVAGRLGIAVWDDAGLSAFLDRMVAVVTQMRAQGRGFRRNENAYEMAALKLLGRS